MEPYNKFRSEFEEALAKEEEFYRHAIQISDVRKKGSAWGLICHRVIQELDKWLYSKSVAHGLQWDPEKVEILKQSMDYGYDFGVGIGGEFKPIPADEVTRDAYELFLCELVDDVREEKLALASTNREILEDFQRVMRPLRWIGIRWCSSCHKLIWSWWKFHPSPHARRE